jgi:hypothetical protein
MLLKQNNPGILDFQDAVYGPITYDLVSLLRDAYIQWDEEQVLDWVIRYWERAKRAGLPINPDIDAFSIWLDTRLNKGLDTLDCRGFHAHMIIKPGYIRLTIAGGFT